MLDCRRDRIDYGEQLRPPSGYRFDRAVAATYSADLGTLLSIPVALVYAQTLEGDLTGARFQLLEAIKQFSGRVRVYHQAGQLHVPTKLNWLYAHLEEALVPILPEDAFTAFHPKIWVIRYVPEEDGEEDGSESEKNRFRVIVLSRNLTFDRSWDVATSLEGEPGKSSVAANAPLVDFIRWLHEQRPIEWVDPFLAELERVAFVTPLPFDGHAFHPLGISGYRSHPLDALESKRTVVLSPFLDATSIQRLRQETRRDLVLFSEPHELARLPVDLLDEIRPFHLSELIVEGESIEAAEEGAADVQKQTLHAKTFVLRTEEVTRWFLGSANATEAARQRNVEFLVELQGTSSATRIHRLLRELVGEKEGEGPFVPYGGEGGRNDPAAEDRRRELRAFEHALLGAPIEARAGSSENGRNFDLRLEFDLRRVPSLSGVNLTVQPFNVKTKSDPVVLQPGERQGCVFPNLGEVELSRFLHFRIEGEDELAHHEFLVRIEIAGLPEDRLDNILRRIIDSQDKFFEYLRFLLADEVTKEDLLATGDDVARDPGGEDEEVGWNLDLPIYEQLLVVASRSPRKLAEVDEVVRHLCSRSEEEEATTSVISEAFLSFWEPFRNLIPDRDERKS